MRELDPLYAARAWGERPLLSVGKASDPQFGVLMHGQPSVPAVTRRYQPQLAVQVGERGLLMAGGQAAAFGVDSDLQEVQWICG